MSMKKKPRVYEGRDITVEYDAARCIHVAECVKGLPAVFDPNRRPWVDPDAATADEIAAVVRRCPTGALHYRGGRDADRADHRRSNCVRTGCRRTAARRGTARDPTTHRRSSGGHEGCAVSMRRVDQQAVL